MCVCVKCSVRNCKDSFVDEVTQTLCFFPLNEEDIFKKQKKKKGEENFE